MRARGTGAGEDTSMLTTFTADLTSTLAPFGWGAVGFVVVCLGAVVTALIAARASRLAAPTRAATSAPPRTSAIRKVAPVRARPTDDQNAAPAQTAEAICSAPSAR